MIVTMLGADGIYHFVFELNSVRRESWKIITVILSKLVMMIVTSAVSRRFEVLRNNNMGISKEPQ